jgi:hypothetical protein
MCCFDAIDNHRDVRARLREAAVRPAPGPASESRQRTKPRGVGHPADQRALGELVGTVVGACAEDVAPAVDANETPKLKPGRMRRATRLRRNRADLEPLQSDFTEPRRCQP